MESLEGTICLRMVAVSPVTSGVKQGNELILHARFKLAATIRSEVESAPNEETQNVMKALAVTIKAIDAGKDVAVPAGEVTVVEATGELM